MNEREMTTGFWGLVANVPFPANLFCLLGTALVLYGVYATSPRVWMAGTAVLSLAISWYFFATLIPAPRNAGEGGPLRSLGLSGALKGVLALGFLVGGGVLAWVVIDDATTPSTWDGTWEHVFAAVGGSTGTGTMELRLAGDSAVVGTYSAVVGDRTYGSSLTGRVAEDGRVLEGEWRNDYDESGRFSLNLGADGLSFQGIYSVDPGPLSNAGNTWRGTRTER